MATQASSDVKYAQRRGDMFAFCNAMRRQKIQKKKSPRDKDQFLSYQGLIDK